MCIPPATGLMEPLNRAHQECKHTRERDPGAEVGEGEESLVVISAFSPVVVVVVVVVHCLLGVPDKIYMQV